MAVFVENVHIVYINKFSFLPSCSIRLVPALMDFIDKKIPVWPLLWNGVLETLYGCCSRGSHWKQILSKGGQNLSTKCSSKVACNFKSPSFPWFFLVCMACIRQTDVSSIKALNSSRNGKSTVSVDIFFHWLPALFVLFNFAASSHSFPLSWFSVHTIPW